MTDMDAYERPHVARLLGLLEEDSSMRIVAITGPRQTGKTTIARPGAEPLGGDRADVLVCTAR